MTIHVGNITVGLNEDQNRCYERAISKLGISADQVLEQYIVKHSVDARKRTNILLNYTVGLKLRDESTVKAGDGIRIINREDLTFAVGQKPLEHRPVVVGFGPAGIFCGLYLARLGYRPIILERGGSMEERIKAVDSFQSGAALSPECNVQFGEGGAGTFSDGKLTTRINDKRCDAVLAEFAAAGAPAEILRSAKPHIGTDYIRNVVKAMRQEIISLGGEVRFNTRLLNLITENNKVKAVVTADGEIPTETVVLAMGHSARDTFEMLWKMDVPMETKPFSVGARIEHLQSDVDKALYGEFAGHPLLPKGEYQLSWRDNANDRAAYTFCMCPGGYVVPAASMEDTIVTNGMSYYGRDGKNANSALVVSVDKRDFGENPMDAVAFQTAIERKAFAATSGYKAPIQTVKRFLEGRAGAELGRVEPSYSIGTQAANFDNILPAIVTAYMRKGLCILGHKQAGFNTPDAVLTGPETRTSSPVRILRDGETLCSTGVLGLYPCGEGSGYAGGIMSAAVDGIRVAEKIIEIYKPFA
ncbi:MAG: FAD-dependent oxidoreductase [Angelakisella sp.]